MERDYKEYLEEATERILEIVSSPDISEEEKEAIIEAFSNELLNSIDSTSGIQDNEPMLYEISVKFIDRRISEALADQDISYSSNEAAIRFCHRQQELFVLFKKNNWKLPHVDNRNIEKCLTTFNKRRDSILITSKINNNDQQLDELLERTRTELSVETCDMAAAKLSDLEMELKSCKSKRIPLPPINNKNTRLVRKDIANLRKEAEQKEALHRRIYDLDSRIHSLVSIRNTTPDQWKEIVGLCQRQEDLLSECRRHGWPLPQIGYDNPGEVGFQYNHYLGMLSVDRQLTTERGALTSKKRYNNYFLNCEKQQHNIEICEKNAWDIPDLNMSDPLALLNTVRNEKSKKDRTNRVRGIIIGAGILCVLILAGGIFGIYKYRESRVQIPFDPSYVSGEDLKDIYDELDHAGFENITKKPNDSGWMNSETVTDVTIDNSDSYKKGAYEKPDVNVVINYSSEGRIFVTDLLADWQSKDYKTLKTTLEQAGLTNITVEEVETADKEKNMLAAALSLNGDAYTNETCYLPKNAPVVISYYVLKIGIGNDSNQFIGQDYKEVVKSLKESGFTNVKTQKIITGWAKGNTVVGVTVNNVEDYDSSTSFDPDVKIVVKYSSNDRIEATPALDSWQTKDYEEVRDALKKAGFTNTKVASKETNDNSKNHLIADIFLNNQQYIAGDCYLQKDAPIILDYYTLAIKIGNTAKGFKGKNYSDVVADLQKKGFTNISLLRANNLISGWLTKEGTIKDFTINGSSDFKDKDAFDYDAPIVIVVNTFKGKGCDDITEIAK